MKAYVRDSINIKVNGKNRNMIVFSPNAKPDNMPLMIVTHGMNQDPKYQYESDQMFLMVDTAKFVVAYLRSDGNTWDIGGTNDQTFVLKTIDAMYTKFKINKNRVYWSGFSMGSMLMYHCMANMVDKIAAFAPTSGVQFSEQPWKACKKPVNLIHCHAYGDGVFKYDEYKIHEYVENMAKMNKSTSYAKIANYKSPGAWFDGDKEIWSNPMTGHVVELYSYNNGGHWPQQANGREIWNFCKRFSLNLKDNSKAETSDYKAGTMEQPTEFDPNFHIYLCFGQSNMEGNAPIEKVDCEQVDSRFRMMAAVNMNTTGRKRGKWYVAYPPLCRDYTGLTPADYFGRAMVEKLPENIKVGVINVAVGGASIKLFDESICSSEIRNSADWFKSYCAEYGNNPYKRLVECAREAQKVGVIKGILLHQGCSDNGQQDWPAKVKRVYKRLLNDLGLKEEETPLIVGELLQQNVGGICYGHNEVISHITDAVPNAYVVSSAGCPGAIDGLHFTAEGYRKIGERYADAMLSALNTTKQINYVGEDGNLFPFNADAFHPSLYYRGSFGKLGSFASFSCGGDKNVGGWRNTEGFDLSPYKYLVFQLGHKPTTNVYLHFYDTDDCMDPCYTYTNGMEKSGVVDLTKMTKPDGSPVDPSHIYIVGFSTDKKETVFIRSFFLSDDGLTPTGVLSLSQDSEDNAQCFDLMGRPIAEPTHGVYIKGGKKYVK